MKNSKIRTLKNAAEVMRDSEDFHELAADVYALARKVKKSAQADKYPRFSGGMARAQKFFILVLTNALLCVIL